MTRKTSLSLVFSSLAMAGFITAPSLLAAEPANSNQGYYRAPHLVGDQLVFTAEGDIWLTSLAQSTPQRLTSSEAEEHQAKLSPNGDFIAFVADYEGVTEVYVMPVQGGTPKRVSFEQSRVRLQSWTPNGNILYSTDHVMGPANQWVLRQVNPSTLVTETIPLVDAIEGVTDDQGKNLFFTRFGLQATSDNARVYRGGAMGEIWRYTLGSKQEAVHLTENHAGSVRKPMYWQGRVYFISDADGTPNIWSVAETGGEFTQHTHYNDWQVWDATLSQGKIVYQQGADLHLLDLASKQHTELALTLASDFRQRQERWLTKPLNYLTHVSFGGTDEQVVLTARSQIALAAKAPRRLVTIDTPSISRSRNAVISHDGKWVYAINDQSGENEIWRFAADGSADAKRLTTNGTTFRWNLYLSPNGRYLAHDDKDGNLWLLDVNNAKNTKIYSGANGHMPMSSLAWSADSQAIAFARTDLNGSRNQVLLYSLTDQRTEVVTSNKYDSSSPTFSPDGNWLYFLSNRNFKASPSSPWGDRNMGAGFNKRTQLFAVALKQQACFPFAAPTEVTHCDDDAAKAERTAKRHAKLIDWDGLAQRLWQVPVEADNYYNLTATDARLYVQARNDGPATLYQIPFAKTDIARAVFATNVTHYQLSTTGKRLFFRQSKPTDMFVVDAGASAPSDLSKSRIATGQWQLALNPQVEWQQMFHDAWLMHRDFLFDRNMRGVDWQAMHKQYAPLVARLTDRNELDDLFAQLLSELNVLHSQVRGGEYTAREHRPTAASLAAAFAHHADGLEIKHIYQTDPELPAQAAPFAQPGVKVAVGDVITHINGAPIKHLGDLTSALRGQAGKQVRLELKRGRSTWSTVVEPTSITNDHRLRYDDWVYSNRAKVAKASDGNYGYIHLYAMGAGDIANFARDFYDNLDKEGLIIDVRRNRGGNIDSWIIEKLLRRAWMFWQPRQGVGYTNMQQTFRGQLVVLTDQLTYSDGETFSAGVKTLGLGPLIGKRTAGAGVWLSGRNTLADRGVARVAETPQHAMDGTWVVEGYGVEPNIEVENLPYATFNGQDAQLERGIAELRQQLKANPYPALKAGDLSAPYGADPVRR